MGCAMPNRYNLLSDVYEFALSGHADAFAASFCRYLVRTAQRRSVPTLFTGRKVQDEIISRMIKYVGACPDLFSCPTFYLQNTAFN